MVERVLCARCGALLAAGRVEVTAAQLAERLWALTVSGVCWTMLKHAIDWELAGAGPGGHLQASDERIHSTSEPGDVPNGSPALGDVERTD